MREGTASRERLLGCLHASWKHKAKTRDLLSPDLGTGGPCTGHLTYCSQPALETLRGTRAPPVVLSTVGRTETDAEFQQIKEISV